MKKRITQIYVYLMLTLFLFFTGFSGYSNIFTYKCILFTAISLLYVILSLVLGISSRKFGIAEISALVYLSITALSAFTSPHFPDTLIGISRYEGLLTTGLYVTVFIAVSHNRKNDNRFPLLLSTVMLIQSSVVIFQLLGFNVLWLYPKGINYYVALERYNGAFISTVGNSDISSAFFSLITPILWGLTLTCKKHRPLHLAAALSSLLCLLLMSVSAGVVAIIITAVIIPFVMLPKRRGLVLLLLLISTALALTVVYFIPVSDGTIFELQSLMHGRYDPDFGSGRLHIWREVLDNLRPLLGTGPDTMLREEIQPFVKTVNGQSVVRRIDIAHNDYLNILFHQGIFALVAYLGMLIPLMYGWLRNGSRNKTAAILGTGVFSYLVQVFFSYSACSSAIFFWIILGMLNSSLQDDTTSCTDENQSTPHHAFKPHK